MNKNDILIVKDIINDLGYSYDHIFPEIKKIENMIDNNQTLRLGNVISDLQRRMYEIGIINEKIDEILDNLYRKYR